MNKPITHTLRLILVLAALLLPTVTFAYRFEANGIYYNTLANTEVEVTGLRYTGDVIIPEKVTYDGNKYSVTTIGSSAFFRCESLTSVTIPNSVISIGDYAFYHCESLTSVTIGNSVTSIGDEAFRGCSGLTSVTIPNSMTSIGRYAFDGCSGLNKAEFASIESLCKINFNDGYSNPLYYAHHLYIDGKEVTDVTIPNSVTSIGRNAFEGCESLTSVTIPNSVTSIGYRAFDGCTGLNKAEFASIESLCKINFDHLWSNPLYYAHHLYINGKEVTDVTIPNSVTSIGYQAFKGCSGLTSVTIPNSVTSIGGDAFGGCTGLNKAEFASIESLCKINFNSGYSNPLYYAHHLYINGKEVTDVTIPNSVTSIGGYAFNGCSGLTSVTIPNSVTSIGDNAFRICKSLTSVTIPNSVTKIGTRAFLDCKSLNSINCRALVPPAVDSSVFEESVYAGASLKVPEDAIAAYKEHEVWGRFSISAAPQSAIIEVDEDVENADGPFDIYNFRGVLVKRDAVRDDIKSLSPDVYIVRQGAVTRKIVVR